MTDRPKKRTLFDPDAIATRLYQAVDLDLAQLPQMYNCNRPSLDLASSIRKTFLKKYVPQTVKSETLDVPTYAKFAEVREHMGVCELPDMSGFKSLQTLEMTDVQAVLWRARNIVAQVLGQFDEDEWFLNCKHGRGSSIGVSFRDTTLEAKSTLPISTTERCRRMLLRYFEFDPELKRAVDFFNGHQPFEDWFDVVPGSRATTVPKSSLINRMIAIEPTANMFLQQGLMETMYERMRGFGLDVETLPIRHRDLAQIGSISGELATIDWSSASDTVHYELVKWLLPLDWFWAVDMVRSPLMCINEEWVDLPMFSTMGNATTFPIETLVFWSLAVATYWQTQESRNNRAWLSKDDLLKAQCSVFGDDCIVPVTMANEYIEVCTAVGFIVNDDKSFIDPIPGFRESCGGDFLRGYDVRGVYLRAPSNTRVSSLAPWLYTLINRLTQKYIQCFGRLNWVYDKEAFYELAQVFKDWKIPIRIVPSFYPEDSGLRDIDAVRVLQNYCFAVAPIHVDVHGSISFSYHSFRFRKAVGSIEYATERDDGLHYALSLKRGRHTQMTKIRQKRGPGGYHVARAVTGCWTLVEGPRFCASISKLVRFRSDRGGRPSHRVSRVI